MYIVPIGWLYVTMMMAVAEATSANGTVLGAIITFILYGLMPTGIMVYLMTTPARKRAIKAREAAEAAEFAAEFAAATASETQIQATAVSKSAQPDAGSHAPAAAQTGGISAVRKEP